MSTNNNCTVMVDQWVPTGMSGKNVPVPCGSTGVHGDEIRCEKCSEERPWYICKHGVDHSGDRDCACAACELED